MLRTDWSVIHAMKPEPSAIQKSGRMLETALDLFSRCGFDKTTIDDIVDAAGFGKGTFYRYFKNKNQVLDILLESHFARLTRAVEGAIDHDRPLAANLLKVLRAYVKVLREDCQLCRIVEETKIRMGDEFFKKFVHLCSPQYFLLRAAIEKDMAGGRFRLIKPDLFLTSLLGTVHMLHFREIKLNHRITDTDLKQILSILLQGVITPSCPTV